jgi:hypothetical protein
MGGDVVGGCGRVERLHFGCHFRVEKGCGSSGSWSHLPITTLFLCTLSLPLT